MHSLQTVEIADDLVQQARAGDRLAHERLYVLLSKPVYTLIRRLVVRPPVAQEILQDVFVEILRKAGDYRGNGSFAGWVRSIALSKALMYLRSPWHRGLDWLSSDSIVALHEEAALDSAPLDEDLERALEMLPALSRAVVWLHDVEGFTHAEIARLFGRSTSFSKSQLARAHETLRQRLKPQTGDLACMPLSKNY